MLNSKLSMDWAQAFAGRVVRIAGPDRARQVEAAYRVVYSRRPAAPETEAALEFFDRQRAILSRRPAEDSKDAALPGLPAGMDPMDGAALVDFCHALMNSNEFVYRN